MNNTNIDELIDIRFFIEDESTTSRAIIKFDNVSHFETETISNFSGSSGATYPCLILKEKINPFSSFWIKELILTHDEYEIFIKRYNAIVETKTKVTF